MSTTNKSNSTADPAGMTPVHWRLLNVGERLQKGDEEFIAAWTDDDGVKQDAEWQPVSVGFVCGYSGPVRRRMDTEPDPAEPLRRELLAGRELILELMVTDGGDRGIGRRIAEWMDRTRRLCGIKPAVID